jgi:WD40 repeat protein
VASGSGDGTVKVWQLDTGAIWDEIDCTDSGAVTHAVWSPRGAGAEPLLLTAHYSLVQSTARVLVRRAQLSSTGGTCTSTQLCRRRVNSPLRNAFVSQVWDFQCKERTRPLQQYARVFPKRGAFTGRFQALQAANGADGPLAVVRTLADAFCIKLAPAQCTLHACRPADASSGTRCIHAQFAAGDGSVTVLEPATGQVLFTLRDAHAPSASRPGAHPAGGGGGIRGGAMRGTATAACLSPSGRLLATAGVDNTIKARVMRCVCAAFVPARRLALRACVCVCAHALMHVCAWHAQVWDASEGALLCVFVGHAAPPRSLVWARGGDAMLASGGGDAAPRVWAVPPPATDA